jgi:hypothetical protein
VEGGAEAQFVDPYGAVADYSKNGVLTLTVNDLSAGKYWF